MISLMDWIQTILLIILVDRNFLMHDRYRLSVKFISNKHRVSLHFNLYQKYAGQDHFQWVHTNPKLEIDYWKAGLYGGKKGLFVSV